jgi:hypothetical protein
MWQEERTPRQSNDEGDEQISPRLVKGQALMEYQHTLVHLGDVMGSIHICIVMHTQHQHSQTWEYSPLYVCIDTADCLFCASCDLQSTHRVRQRRLSQEALLQPR